VKSLLAVLNLKPRGAAVEAQTGTEAEASPFSDSVKEWDGVKNRMPGALLRRSWRTPIAAVKARVEIFSLHRKYNKDLKKKLLSIPSVSTEGEMISRLQEIFSVAESYYKGARALRHEYGIFSEANEVIQEEGPAGEAARYVAILTDATMIVLQNVLRTARDEAGRYGIGDLGSRYRDLVGDDEVSMVEFADPAALSVAEEAGVDDPVPVEGSTSAQVTSPYGDSRFAATARSFAKSNVALDVLDAEIDNNYPEFPEFPEELRGQFGEGAQQPGDAPSTSQRGD
jgi:hypothetical protein